MCQPSHIVRQHKSAFMHRLTVILLCSGFLGVRATPSLPSPKSLQDGFVSRTFLDSVCAVIPFYPPCLWGCGFLGRENGWRLSIHHQTIFVRFVAFRKSFHLLRQT